MGVSGSPEWTAAQYTTLSNSVVHTWPSIGYWVTLVQPYVTQAYASQLAVLAGAGASSSDAHLWQVVETNQEDIGAKVSSALVIQEAGVTATSEIIRVTWYPTVLSKTARDAGVGPSVSGSSQQADDHMTKVGSTWEVASVASASEGA
jgi:hypothetical protein